MCNEFEKNTPNSLLSTYNDWNTEISIQSMFSEFLLNKSNNVKLKNKYLTSIQALKSFVRANS